MKKLVFIGISLFGAVFCVDDLWGEPARKTDLGANKNIFSDLKLDYSISAELKKIVACVPSSDIRSLTSNMSILSRSLPRKSEEEDLKTVINKMNEASDCLEELLRVKSNLYQELFNRAEKRAELTDSVSLDSIIRDLNRVDLKRLSKIISICKQEGLSERILRILKDFSAKVEESKNILGEMKGTFSSIMLSRIEGIPELKHLESTDTSSNRELAKHRRDLDLDRDSEDDFEKEKADLDDKKDSESEISSRPTENSPKNSEEDENRYENDRLNREKEQTLLEIWKAKVFGKKTDEEKKDSESDERQDDNSLKSESDKRKSFGKRKRRKFEQSESENSSKKSNEEDSFSLDEKDETDMDNEPTEKRRKRSKRRNKRWQSEQNKQLFEEDFKESNAEKGNEPVDNSKEPEYEKGSEEEKSNESKNLLEKTEQKEEYSEKKDDGFDDNSEKMDQETESAEKRKNLESSSVENEDSSEEKDNQSATTDSDSPEGPEKFFKSLETSVKSLDDNALTSKQKTVLAKVNGYLKETKSARSFEQKVGEVRRIIRSYNSLVALNPKTKNGKKLSSVRLDKIKSFQEAIYLRIFDDLNARIKRLKSNKKFNGLDFQEDFNKLFSLNKENKEKFKKSESGKDKRKIMTSSADAYDKLIEKIWKYPELVKTKKDREEFDRIGYTLDPVILSIDVNSK